MTVNQITEGDQLLKEWYEKLAEKGDIESQYLLGSMLEKQKDYLSAYKWFKISSKSDHKKAKLGLEETKSKLTPEQIIEGDRLVQEWFESLK